jgi:hypothetical protein
MTTSILNISDSIDVDVASLLVSNKANCVLIDTTKLPDGGRESLYQHTAGDAEFPMEIRAGFYPQPKAENGTGRVNVSIRINTFVKNVVDTETLWTLPANAVIAWSLPGRVAVPTDATELLTLLSQAFSWIVPIQSGVAVEGVLDDIAYGVVSSLQSFTNSGT